MEHLYPLPMTFGTLTLALFGVFGNGVIITAIVAVRQLHSRCNFLIAYLAAADFIASVYYVSLRGFILNYDYNMPNSRCFQISSYGLFAMNVQTGLTFMLGVDRYLCISYPFKYRQWQPTVYLLLMLLPAHAYAAIVIGFGFWTQTDELTVAVCFPPTAYNGVARLVWMYSNFVMVIAVLAVYTLAHHSFKKRWTGSTDRSLNNAKHVLGTLIVVMFVFTATWVFTAFSIVLIQLLGRTDEMKALELQLGWPVVINASTNFIIYYWRSTEMRRGFQQVLGIRRLRHIFVLETTVVKTASDAAPWATTRDRRGSSVVSTSGVGISTSSGTLLHRA